MKKELAQRTSMVRGREVVLLDCEAARGRGGGRTAGHGVKAERSQDHGDWKQQTGPSRPVPT